VSRKEELEKIIKDAREELAKIKDKEWAEQSAQLVGKYFRLREWYVSGDLWWSYVEITGLGERGFTVMRFQKTSDGKIIVGPDGYSTRGIIDSAEEITEEEFCQAWSNLLEEIL